MTQVRLEIDRVEILRPKERWRLYFVIVADHPTDASQMVVTVTPQEPILVAPRQSNVVTFDTDRLGSEGFMVLSRDMPASRELNVHLYVMHSRRSLRALGQVLSDIQTEIGPGAGDILTNILGANHTWLVIAREALPLIGNILRKIPDRNMGFVSMFERFGEEFEQQAEVDDRKVSGHVAVTYSWSVEHDNVA